MNRVEKIKKDLRDGFARSVSRDAAGEIRRSDLTWAVEQMERLECDYRAVNEKYIATKAIRDKLEAENKTLRKKCEERTIALQQAIGMAQESILPSPGNYNRWRALLGNYNRWRALLGMYSVEND
jgi:hypothetical protein